MTTPAAELARLRKTGRHTCPHCGRVFVALAAAKYCGAPCRMAAAYQRRKAATSNDPLL